MMDHVVHNHGPQHADTRHGEDGFSSVEERPLSCQRLIAGCGDGGPRLRHTLIEKSQNLGFAFKLGLARLWSARRVHVEAGRFQRQLSPVRNGSNVRSQCAHTHGLRVRLPIEFAVRHALKTLTRVGHLVIEFPQ